MRKKKVLFLSNHAGIKTGFGGFMLELLTYLYKTGKYEIGLVAAGLPFQGTPEHDRFPWKTYGTIPNHRPDIIQRMNQDPNFAREVSYGMPTIDEAILDFKPDTFIGCEDIWAFSGAESKVWWNKINSVIHTTLDSVPILSRAYEIAKSTPNFYVWSEFAEREMKKNGIDHVKTIHGCVNTNEYKRLSGEIRRNLRHQHNIPTETFVVGMLSRNQLRKLYPTAIEGFATFKKQNPQVKTVFLTFCCWAEGWNLKETIKENGLASEDVLACYKCRATGKYFILPFTENDRDNPETGHQKSLVTVSIQDGLTYEQVNEWYNLLDCFVHPITSGALERSVSEAKLVEIPCLINAYSCFEDQVGPNTGSLDIDQGFTYEIGTNFKKAAPSAWSIAKLLKKVYEMPESKKREIGKAGRNFVINNYSIEVVGKQYEELLDSLPEHNWDFKFEVEAKDPNAEIENIPDNLGFILGLYKKILRMDMPPEDQGVKHWVDRLIKGEPREQVVGYFRGIGQQENAKNQKVEFSQLLGPEGKEDRILIVLPESVGDLINLTALLKDAREVCVGKKLYVATKTQFKDILKPLVGEFIDYVIDWMPEMDNELVMQKFFKAAIMAHVSTQRFLNYLRGGEHFSKINLNYEAA